LLLDLFSRTPGTFIKWDATFALAMKTSDDAESEEKINALAIGEFSHILSFAFSQSENPVTETAWNARVGRTGDVGLPGQNWSRSLGGQNTTASAISTYLPDTVSLSNFQLERFWGIVSTECRVGGLHAGTEAMVSKVVAVWQDQHLRSLQAMVLDFVD